VCPRRRFGPTDTLELRRLRVGSCRATIRPVIYHREEIEMGKYFFAWILGVPAVVLVGIYLLSHL
jgi:hypothetical protein